jgi:hypothetical protein
MPWEGLIWWRCDLHCGDMASVLLALLLRVQACAPLLGEWFLSFDVVATCPVIPGLITGVVCLSLQFDRHRGPRPRRRESWCDLILIVEIVA